MGATASSIDEVGDKLSNDCSRLSNWMAGNRFKLNAGKTHLMTMGTAQRLQSLDSGLKVEMDGMILKHTEEASEVLLGVNMQCNLKWSEHITNLRTKLKKRWAGLNKLRHILNYSTRKNVVQGIFNSVLCYCLPLFGGCTIAEIMALQVQQNQAAQCPDCAEASPIDQ